MIFTTGNKLNKVFFKKSACRHQRANKAVKIFKKKESQEGKHGLEVAGFLKAMPYLEEVLKDRENDQHF